MLDLLRPVQVGDVHQAVDALLEPTNKPKSVMFFTLPVMRLPTG